MGGESSERASGESEGEALRVINGEMSEWLKEHAWKACVGETLPWVRIPLSPPLSRAPIPREKVAQVFFRRRGFAPAAPPLRTHSRGPLGPAPFVRAHFAS